MKGPPDRGDAGNRGEDGDRRQSAQSSYLMHCSGNWC